MLDNIQIRTLSKEDGPFILNSWLTSYFDGSSFARLIPQHIFYSFHKNLILGIIGRNSSSVLIASDKEDPDLIYGYAVFERIPKHDIIHYVYVKKAFGKLGIASDLILTQSFEGKCYATHSTGVGSYLFKKFNLIYCPYLVG